MYPFFESIKCYNGRIYHLPYHEERIRRTRQQAYGQPEGLDIRQAIHVPMGCQSGLYKCKVTYGKALGSITFSPYQPQPIKTLQPVEIDFDYSYKTVHRAPIAAAYERRGHADDIIMIKDGLVTDSRYHNIIIKTDRGLLTPTRPLLPGTMRAYLLDRGRVAPEHLSIADLQQAHLIYLVNALNPLGRVVIDPSDILPST